MTTLPTDEQPIFGCLVNWQPAEPVWYNGLRQANEDFLKAIIRYSHFAELHFFLADPHIAHMQAHWQAYFDRFGSDKRIRLLSVSQLPAYFARRTYRVFHQGDPYIATLAGLRDRYAARPFPITGRAHTLSTDTTLAKARDLLLAPVKPWDAILCSANAQRQALQQLLRIASARIETAVGVQVPYRGQLCHLPLGIGADPHVTAADHLASQAAARTALKYHQDTLILLSLGRFSATDKMDLHPLLLAANDLLEDRQLTNFLLVLAGDGDAASPYVQSLLQQAYTLNLERHVRLELSVDAARKQQLFQAADIFVAVADNVQESFGLAPLEAMQQGIPVVLSDWNGYRELVEDGCSGVLVDTLTADHDELSQDISTLWPQQAHSIQAQGTAVDVEALVAALAKLMHQPTLRQAMGAQAKQRVMERFQWPVVIGAYQHIVADLCHQAQRSTLPAKRRAIGLSYHTVFGHYGSTELSNQHIFVTSDRGTRMLLLAEPGYHHPVVHELVCAEVVKALALFCIEPYGFRVIKAAFANTANLAFTLLWMVKYQLIIRLPNPLSVPSIYCRRRGQLEQVPTADGAISAAVKAAVQGIERRQASYIEPVLAWLEPRLAQYITPLDRSQGTLLIELLALQANWLAAKVLQAMAWLGEQQGLASYAAIGELLDQHGGLSILRLTYPYAYCLGKRSVVRFCRGIKRLVQRLQADLVDINRYFGDAWDQPARGLVQVQLPLEHDDASVAIISFDNGKRLVYKARDVRIDRRLVGANHTGVDSLAQQVNRWLGDQPGLATHKILPRMEANGAQRYGYAAYLAPSATGITLTESQAREYYQRLGVMAGFAVLLGLSDVHHLNVITQQQIPYLVDLETVFHSEVLRCWEQELNTASVAFMDGIAGSSFEKTHMPAIWQSFHTRQQRLCAVTLDQDALVETPAGQWLPVVANAIRVGERHGLDAKQPPLAACYSEAVTTGVTAVLQAVCGHPQEWLAGITACRGMQVRYQPLINYDAMGKHVSDLHVFLGFQRWSTQRLQRYCQRLARHLCLAGQTSQQWFAPQWQEPLVQLAPDLAAMWLTGQQPTWVKCLGRPGVAIRTTTGGLNKVADSQTGFTVDGPSQAQTLFKRLSSNVEKRALFIARFTAMLQQWLAEPSAAPVAQMPAAAKAIALRALESA